MTALPFAIQPLYNVSPSGLDFLRQSNALDAMLRNPQISARSIFPFCRSLGRMLQSGVQVRKALKSASTNSRDPRLTSTVARVIKAVGKGEDLTGAFQAHSAHYPPLFLDLLNVGEQTGALPEVFASLADYYEAHVNRMRDFRSQIAWPLIQLFAAILIIGLLIYILGIIGQQGGAGSEPADVLGLGLVGTAGAIKWFMMTFGSLAMLWIGYVVVSRSASGKSALDPFLMKIPGVGGCMRAFAIARFSWCFALTQSAGMPLKPSIESSLKATTNGAFIAAIPHVWRDLADGETLTDALRATTLFPTEYLHLVETGEQTGTVPETLDRLSQNFDEDAHRAMTWMTTMLARLIWGLVACFIGFIVISFFMNYVSMIKDAMTI